MKTRTQPDMYRQRTLTTRPILLFWITIACLALGFAPQAGAAVRYVKWDATGLNDGTSWADAYPSLQTALTVVGSGDEIWVAAGTYKPTTDGNRRISFELKTGVALYSGFAGTETSRSQRDWTTNVTILNGDLNGDDDTVGNGENSYHVVVGSNTDNTAVLDGFTITGGNANGANPLNRGGGMYNSSGSPTVTNCTFSGNTAANYGGGMYNASNSPSVTNCTFSNNTATDGGGMYNASSSPSVTNCTFSNNTATDGGGMYNYYGSPTITNTILWENTPDQINNNASTPVVTYCDIEGGYDGEGNINRDPRFVDADNGNVHLLGNSPCINAGTNTGTPPDDMDGQPRPFSPRVDIGADEFIGAYIDNDNGDGTGDGLPDYWEYYYFGDDNLTQGDNDDPDMDGVTNLLEFWSDTHPDWNESMVFVDGQNGNNNNSGHSWTQAKQTIQAGIDEADNGHTVIVRSGTETDPAIYTGDDNRELDFGGKAITLRSESGAATTIIDCENSARGFTFKNGETADAVVDGFTIRNGSADVGGGMKIKSSSPTITNMIFEFNTATQNGGGLFIDSAAPMITDSTISNNSADNGGGIYLTNSSSASITDCTFSGNTAPYGGGCSMNLATRV